MPYGPLSMVHVYSTLPCVTCHVAHCQRYTCIAHCHVSHAMWPTVYGTRVQHTAMCLMPCGPLSTVHVYSTLPCVSCHVAHCLRYTCTAHCHVSHAMWPTVNGTRVQHTAMCLMPHGPLSTVHVYSTLPCVTRHVAHCQRYTCTAHCHVSQDMWPTVNGTRVQHTAMLTT